MVDCGLFPSKIYWSTTRWWKRKKAYVKREKQKVKFELVEQQVSKLKIEMYPQ